MKVGHFVVAKLCKVRVNEFAIGFGKLIYQKQKGETKYSLRLFPIGGFCSMEGETEESEVEGSFSKVSIPKRMAIVAARWNCKYCICFNCFFHYYIYYGNSTK